MNVDIHVRRDQSGAIDTGFDKKREEQLRREAIQDFTNRKRELIFAWFRVLRAGASKPVVQP